MRNGSAVVAMLFMLASAGVANAQSVDSADARLRKTVDDYVGLYTKTTLDAWEKLFLPSFSAANTRSDGGTSPRTRDEFFASQRRYHERRDVTEALENVRIERSGRLASIWADFIVTDSEQKSRGRLVLLAMDDGSQWKFHSLMFGYDR